MHELQTSDGLRRNGNCVCANDCFSGCHHHQAVPTACMAAVRSSSIIPGDATTKLFFPPQADVRGPGPPAAGQYIQGPQIPRITIRPLHAEEASISSSALLPSDREPASSIPLYLQDDLSVRVQLRSALSLSFPSTRDVAPIPNHTLSQCGGRHPSDPWRL
jgi:hypothetical protein